MHPAGRNYERLPSTSSKPKAAAWPASRPRGTRPGPIELADADVHPEFPHTLDLGGSASTARVFLRHPSSVRPTFSPSPQRIRCLAERPAGAPEIPSRSRAWPYRCAWRFAGSARNSSPGRGRPAALHGELPDRRVRLYSHIGAGNAFGHRRAMSDLLSQLAGSLRPCRVFMAGTLAATFGGWDMAAWPRPLASGLLVLALAACGGPNAEQERRPRLRCRGRRERRADAALRQGRPAAGRAVDLGRGAGSAASQAGSAARANPRHRRGGGARHAARQLPGRRRAPAGRRGAAQQVSPGRGLPRSQPDQDVCALHVADAPLNVTGGFRSFPDLRWASPSTR